MRKIIFGCICGLSLILTNIQAQDLIISEVCPSNATGITFVNNEYPDWIELQNISNHAINLSDYKITDKAHISLPFDLPNITMAAGSYVVLRSNTNTVAVTGVAQWETVIDKGDTWKYLVPTSEPVTDWRSSFFNDASWSVGPSGFGFGDGDDATELLNISSVFLRSTFTVSDVSNVYSAILHMDFDDSFVAYINGVEVARSGLSDAFPAFDVLEGGNEAQWYQGNPIQSFDITNFQSVLVNGTNTIAIQVHNGSVGSSDLSAIPILSLGYKTVQTGTKPVSSLTGLAVVSTEKEVHFKIGNSKETIYLFKDNVITDSLFFDNVPADASVGRYNQNIYDSYYFEVPTPGFTNSTTKYLPETLSKPIISVAAGEYSSAFQVYIYNTEPDSYVFYTTDGSEPDEASSIYSGPITINKNTNLRARVYKSDCLPSSIRTASYIFHVKTMTLPIISISMNEGDLFDENVGIYVLGPNAEPDFPNFGANFWQDWEKPCHVDFIETDGSLQFSYDLGVKISGNYSRAQEQKSLKFYARSIYGANAIEYQLFKDKQLFEFQSFIVRNSGNDFNNSQMRDGMISSLVRNMDVTRSAYRPCIVYINGEYYGIQNIREKINKDFVSTNYNISNDSLALMTNNAYGDEGINHGDPTNYYDLVTFLENNDLSIQANYDRVAEDLNIDDAIKYHLIEMFVVNEDWPGNNRKYWRDINADGAWRFILWDLDFGFGIWDVGKAYNNMLDFALTNDPGIGWPNPPWSTLMLRKLTENPAFNERLLNTLADRLNTTFSSDSINYLVDSLYSLIKVELQDHADRWYGSYGYMTQNINEMKIFGANRGPAMRQHFEDHFGTGGSYFLTITSSDNAAGKIHLNTIDLHTFPWTGEYFDNIPISLTAMPAPGYSFVRWEGDVTSTNATISITTNSAKSVHAVYSYNAATVPNVFFTELHYNPKDSLSGGNWVEVYNANSSDLDISGWILKTDVPGEECVIPQGTIISGKTYFVFCTDKTAFTKAHTVSAAKYFGNLGFGFSNSRGVISFCTQNGFVVDKLSYLDTHPWPQKADGYGYSMELINITADRTNPNNWRSTQLLGTPTQANNPVILTANRDKIIINEINYNSHPNSDSGDWFELYNSASSSVDISGWIIKDKSESNMFVIPDGTIIPADGYLVFAQSPTKFALINQGVDFINTNIGLSSYSDMVRVYDQYEYIIDSVSYSMFAPWPMQANGTGKTMALKSPELDNSKGENWEANVFNGTPGRNNADITTIETVESVVSVYPNPANEILYITANGESYTTIYNSLGIQVYTGTDKEIIVSQFTPGMYTICVVVNGEVHTSKIIIE